MSFPPNDDHDQTCSHKRWRSYTDNEGVESELDLFAVPQKSIDDGRWVEHQPLTPLDSGGPIEFMLPGTGYAYLDLANTYLLIRAKAVRGVGADRAADTQVAPVNNWLHSLFSQVDVYLNDTVFEYLPASPLRRYRTELRRRVEEYSTHKPAVVQRHRRAHGLHDCWWW